LQIPAQRLRIVTTFKENANESFRGERDGLTQKR
jgi:hypothetical protein